MNVDLNLLLPLQVLLDERQVSRAAQRLGLTQSAMSRTLQRLRTSLNDELLIRVADGYVLTPRAERIRRNLLLVLPRVNTVLGGEPFDPAVASGVFRLSCPDYQMGAFGPELFRRFRNEAPGSALYLNAMSNRFVEDLKSSRIDVSLCSFPGWTTPEIAFLALPFRPGLMWDRLYQEHNVCVVAADSVLAGCPELSLEEYLRQAHVMVSSQYDCQLPVDMALVIEGRQREVAMVVPHYAAVMPAVVGTDLVATIPARLAAAYGPIAGTVVLAAPAEVRIMSGYMMWHPRLDAEPGQVWMRDLIRQVLPCAADDPLTAADLVDARSEAAYQAASTAGR